ncbi:hypothetical protein [Hyphomicrobium sp.]|uniref:hypothetical protein n=1 Tax=Hyphomicrobium sp. TaxID=82 RepID=UPI003F7190CD
MGALRELREILTGIAERSNVIKSHCTNEESTKLYLILPVIGALGYDYTDPLVVQPELPADFRTGSVDRVDFAIMQDGAPVIAIECKSVGSDLPSCRGQLRSYFSALQTVRLGILTDGIMFEFFVDCDQPNVMDAEPFVTLDLEAATRSPIPVDVLEALNMLSSTNFQPEDVADLADLRLVSRRLRSLLVQEMREPSDDLCRLMLQRLGMKNLRRSSIQTRYSSLVRDAFEQAVVIPVMDRLRTQTAQANPLAPAQEGTADGIVTTDRELAVYRYVRQRLAFLSKDEQQFSAIERLQYQDYLGKFAVYYEQIRKGRLFDFIEGSNGYDKFIFPLPGGEIITNNMKDIDEPLHAIFSQRIRELGASKPVLTRNQMSA